MIIAYFVGATYLISVKETFRSWADDTEATGFMEETKVLICKFLVSGWVYLSYLPAINYLLTMVIGRYVLSGILYPYQNAYAREHLDRSNANKFGDEFSHYLDSFVYTLRVQAGQDVRKSLLINLANDKARSSKGKSTKSRQDTLDESDFPYDFLSFSEMRNVIDLLNLYITVNQEVIKTKSKSRTFKKFHETMVNIKNKIDMIKVESIENPHNVT